MEKRRFSEHERVCSAKRNTSKHILKHRPKARAFAAIAAAAALLFPQPAGAASPTQNPGPACAPDLRMLNLVPLFPGAPRMEYDGGTFGLEATGGNGALGRMLGRVYLTLERGCGKETREVGIPPEDLGEIIHIYYGEKSTLVVSSEAVHILPGAEIFSRPEEDGVRLGPGKITLELPAVRSVLEGNALFVFEEGNNVEILLFSEARRVSAQMPELAPDCVPVEYGGGFIFLQGGDSPVIDLRRTEDGWRHFVYDAGNFSAERLLSYRETESGLVAVFAGGDGSEVAVRISRTEEGRLAFSFR